MDWKMSIKKGDIYLANLGSRKDNDIGKIRPVLIFQNNLLNRMIDDSLYKDVIVIPLSSRVKENDFVFKVNARDRLEKDSILLCNAIKMINSDRLLIDEGMLTSLNNHEIEAVEKILMLLFDCSIGRF